MQLLRDLVSVFEFDFSVVQSSENPTVVTGVLSKSRTNVNV